MTVMEALKKIPVYPESVSLPGEVKIKLASYCQLCEDDRRRISWISQEAKDEFLSKSEPLSKQKQSTEQEQSSKQEAKSAKNKPYTAFGKTQTLHEWADEYGIKFNTLYSRIKLYGMDLEKALTKPKQTNEEKFKPRPFGRNHS